MNLQSEGFPNAKEIYTILHFKRGSLVGLKQLKLEGKKITLIEIKESWRERRRNNKF